MTLTFDNMVLLTLLFILSGFGSVTPFLQHEYIPEYQQRIYQDQSDSPATSNDLFSIEELNEIVKSSKASIR